MGPGPAGQRQAGEAADPHPVGLGGTRLVEQQIWDTAQSVRRIGGARDEGLGQQGSAAVATQPHAQGLAARSVALFPQLDLQPTRAVAAFVVVRDRRYFRFPGRCLPTHRLSALRQSPRVGPAGHYPKHLAELLDGMIGPRWSINGSSLMEMGDARRGR